MDLTNQLQILDAAANAALIALIGRMPSNELNQDLHISNSADLAYQYAKEMVKSREESKSWLTENVINDGNFGTCKSAIGIETKTDELDPNDMEVQRKKDFLRHAVNIEYNCLAYDDLKKHLSPAFTPQDRKEIWGYVGEIRKSKEDFKNKYQQYFNLL